MSPNVNLAPDTFNRLQRLAVPLVDSIDTVIGRLLDFYEATGGRGGAPVEPSAEDARVFDPASPPDLTHTRIASAVFCGRQLNRKDAKWNGLLDTAIREAMARLGSMDEVKRLVTVNHVVGRKTEEGYRFLEDVGMSVQGQDANAAWKAAYHIVRQLGCDVHVVFAWRDKLDAAFPGLTGSFVVSGR